VVPGDRVADRGGDVVSRWTSHEAWLALVAFCVGVNITYVGANAIVFPIVLGLGWLYFRASRREARLLRQQEAAEAQMHARLATRRAGAVT
jgi:hypothetical protein